MIDDIVEMVLKEARGRFKHDSAHGLYEVMVELNNKTQDIYNSLKEDERRKKDDEIKR